MDKRQNSCEGSTGQAKGLCGRSGLVTRLEAKHRVSDSCLHTPCRNCSLLSLFRLLRYFFVSILLKLPGLEPVRGSTRIGGLLEG